MFLLFLVAAKSASLWCIIIATLLIIAYFISQFCIPSLPGGLIGIILTLFSIYASTSLYRQQELFQARMNILYICILLIASGIILGFDAQKFAKLQSTSFPQGCLGANPNDKPDDLPTSCDRYYRLAIAGLLFMSIVCASFVGALISAIVLGGRLHAWKQAGTPNQIVSTTHYVIPPTAENIVMGGDQKRNIDRTTIAPSSLLPSPAIDDPPSNVSSRPLTPVELYHLTDFQLEKGMKRVGSKEMAEV